MSDNPQSSWSSGSAQNFSDLPINAEKERAFKQRQKESLAAIDAALEPLVREHANRPVPKVEKRPLLDLVRDQLPDISHRQREVWQKENYERRRAETLRATSNTKPTEADIAAVNAEAERINAWLDSEHEDESWDED